LVISEERARELDTLHRAPHPLLIELEQIHGVDGIPIVERVTGRLLSTIVTAMQANRILEVGTRYGYWTLWMALAQPPAGRIWTIDPDARRTDVARAYFRRAGEDDSIEVFNTPALELLENSPHRNLDVVFVAANNDEYLAYLEIVIPMLKLSGLAIFTDCLTTHDFLQRFLNHPALDATVLPFGLGIGARRQ
jgi:predicted O-methyltransferase YrrM